MTCEILPTDRIPVGETEVPNTQGHIEISAKLRLSRQVQIESSDDCGTTAYHKVTGTRLRLPKELYQCLREFETPTAIDDVARGDGRLAAALTALQYKNWLVGECEDDSDGISRLFTDAPVRMFDCPRLRPGVGDVRSVVLGIPYDGGEASAAGARAGPAALREASLQLLYDVDARTGRPKGWFDADAGRAILEGVVIADRGDILVRSGEPQRDIFARAEEVLAADCAGDRVPLVVGGDASICLPVIRHLQSRGRLAVVAIGHAGEGTKLPTTDFVAGGQLARHALRLPNVTAYLHMGTWSAGASEFPVTDRLGLFHQLQLRGDGYSAALRLIAADESVLVCLDMRGIGLTSDVNGAVAYSEADSLLQQFAQRQPLAGICLTGLIPSRAAWARSAITALYLSLKCLGRSRNLAGAR